MRNEWEQEDERAFLALEGELQADLLAMKTSAKLYAERAETRERVRSSPRRRPLRLAWATACAALLVAAGGWRMVHRSPGHAGAVHAPALSDEALLKQVDLDLSTAVPAALEPLAVVQVTRSGTTGHDGSKVD